MTGPWKLAGFFVLLAVCAWTGVLQAGEVKEADGVVHIYNSDQPRGGAEKIELKEQWRGGGEDDEIFFGSVAEVLRDEEGNIYLLDSQLSEVKVYSPGGELLKTLSREGEGPGEIRNPSDAFFTPEGMVGMIQAFPGKVVMVDRDGNPAGSYTVGSGDPSQGRFSVLVTGTSAGDATVFAGIHMSFGQQGTSNQTFFLSRCDGEGRELQRYTSKEYEIDYNDFSLDELGMDFAWMRHTAGPDGVVYVAPKRNAYEIEVYDSEGNLLRVIHREYASLERDADLKKTAQQTMEAVGRNYPNPPQTVTIEETEPDIAGLTLLADGRLWVQTSRGTYEPPEDVLAVYDVFDSDGHFEKQVHLVAPGDASRDAVSVLDGGRVIVMSNALDAYLSQQGVESGGEEAGVLEVICYSM
ncbi:MAG: hypothetical protein GF355_14190 [Candidatus Eisenbacteria bacterium]|nr:hypothetical protein [Candidatus Eisenbacteria bacterium]